MLVGSIAVLSVWALTSFRSRPDANRHPRGFIAFSSQQPRLETVQRTSKSTAARTLEPTNAVRTNVGLQLSESDSPATADEDSFQTSVLPFLQNYCLDCHTGEDAESEMDLDKFKSTGDVVADLESWSQVLKRLEQGDMPPDDAAQPSAKARQNLQRWIIERISTAETRDLNLGLIRRLNRVQYENSIRELLRLNRHVFNNSARLVRTDDYFQPATGEMPKYVLAVSHFFNSHRRHSDLPGVSNLPVDPPVEHGFANDQEALSLSPLLMESYFDVSMSMLDSAEFPLICEMWDSMFLPADETDDDRSRQQAHEQIEVFLPRAFRRKISDDEKKRYCDLFDQEFGATQSYTQAMKTTVAAVLVSPNFLYRQEFYSADRSTDAGEVVSMDENFALASRLSYFLWGSMPDDELFQAAREKRLSSPDGLSKQVDRMMKDRRVKSLSTDFGMQWLKVQKAASVLPDETRYPAYREIANIPPAAVSMMIEQMLFFETIMVENRSIEEFVSSDFAYLNRQLMNLYQLDFKKSLDYTPPLIDFEDFFRVKWANSHRGGVITSGAMLIATSTTTRTSPVKRGAWVLDVIFNAPPPAPPANVPPLEPADADSDLVLNVRQELERHRLDPACASCHDRMDPLGFALEKFDAVGRWRNKYEMGDPIDATGQLDGVGFDGASKFKSVILKDKTKFVKAFVEHTMKYALGRQLHYSDQPEIRRITEKVIQQDCRFRAVIKQVVLSEQFRRFQQTPGPINEN